MSWAFLCRTNLVVFQRVSKPSLHTSSKCPFHISCIIYIYRSECKLHICPSSLPMTLNCNLTISCRQRRQQHAKVKRIRFYDLLCNNPPKPNKENHCGCRKQSELLKLAVCVYCRLYFALFCFCAFRRLQFSSGHPTIDLCTD